MTEEKTGRIRRNNPALSITNDKQELPEYHSSFFPVLAKYDGTEDHPSFDIPAHWHNDIEMVRMVDGANEYLVNGVPCRMHEDSVILVKPNVLHSVRNDDNYKAHVLLVNTGLFKGHELHVQKYLRLLEPEYGGFFFFDETQPWYGELRDSFETLYTSCMDCPSGYELEALSSIYHILWLINTHRADTTDFPPVPVISQTTQECLKSMILYINEHYKDKISVDELAGCAHISKSSCDKMFRRVIHQSPIEYIIGVRLAKSVEMLQDGIAVTDTALECGFSSLPYYSKMFKQRVGLSPTEYQKKIRG